jgi:CRISPR system Cascade subunit CasB
MTQKQIQEKPRKDAAQAFVAALVGYAEREDRAALAALRKSLIDPSGMSAAACPYVVPFLGKESHLERDQSFFLIGALFALHPEYSEGVSLGTAFRRLAKASGSDDTESPSVRARFVALLDSHPDDLGEQLRTGVSLLRSHGIGLDWADLLRDLLRFHQGERTVQRRWARHFWGDDSSVTPLPSSPSSSPEVKP